MPRLIRTTTLALCALATPALAGPLTVSVTGVASGAGEVGCALHPEGSGFPTANAGVPTVWVKANPSGVTCDFGTVPPGRYAVAVSHDLNGNRALDTNFLGIPSEDWAVSNNVRPTMRAPTFEEAAITVGKAGAKVAVRLDR